MTRHTDTETSRKYLEQEPVLTVAHREAPAETPSAEASANDNQIAIGGIDDSIVVDFSLEKFNSIRFTVKKKASLFFEDTFPLFIQGICAPFFNIIYRLCFALTIRGKENLKHTKGPMLFISNHIGFYDSFMFDMFVPPFSHIAPFRFMGSRRFIVPFLALLKCIGVIDVVYLLFGVFRITPGEGAEKSLKKAYEIIKNEGTVVMYPEGRIWVPSTVHPEAIGPFKWGAAILAKNTGVQVVPVSMKKTIRTDSKGFMKVRRGIDISIGKPFHVDASKAPEEIAADMRDKVIELFEGRA